MADGTTPEQQAILQQLGVTASEFVTYHSKRIDGRYLTQALATLLTYDYLLTFGDEVEFIWKTQPKVSVAKILFFLNRYWPLALAYIRIWATSYAIPPPAACGLTHEVMSWGGMLSVVIMDVLLMMRVWALYNGSRFVKWFLVALFVTGFGLAAVVKSIPPANSLPLIHPAPQTLTICKRSPPNELFSLFTVALAVDTIIFAMVIYRAGGRQFRTDTPVLTVLVRDGVIYWVFITAVLILMIIACFVPALYQPIADSNLNVPLSALACSRLVLSLRGTYFRTGVGGTGHPSLTIGHRVPNQSTSLESADIKLTPLRSPFPSHRLGTDNQRRDVRIKIDDDDYVLDISRTPFRAP